MKTNNRQLCACGSAFGVILLVLNTFPAFADSVPSSCDFNSGVQSGLCASPVPGGIGVAGWRKREQQTPGRQAGQSSSTVNSQRSRETAEGSASPDAQGAGVGQVCDGMMHMYEKPDGTTDEVACLYFSAAHPPGVFNCLCIRLLFERIDA